MEHKEITVDRNDIAVETQTEINHDLDENNNNVSTFITSNFKTEDITLSPNSSKEKTEIIKEYETKIANMTQTINKLNKKNEDQKQEFILLNEKLNKAFAKLTPNKLKINSENHTESTQELEKTKKELENEMKRNKNLKKTIDHNNSIITDISDTNDKNIRSRTISLSRKKEKSTFESLRKEFLGLSYGNFGNPYEKHDDTLKLEISKGSFTISSLKFIYFEEHIVSLSVTYKFTNGELMVIKTFNVEHSYSNTKSAELNFHEHEYIKELDIYCAKMIEFIQIKTSRDQILEVGNEKSQYKSKKYSFEIKNHEKPVAFAAITENKTINQVKKECLVSLGLIMKKKDVQINKKRVFSSLKDPNTHEENQSETESSSLIKEAVHLEKINEISKNKPLTENEHDKKYNKSK